MLVGVSVGDTFRLIEPDTGAEVGRAIVTSIDADGRALLDVIAVTNVRRPVRGRPARRGPPSP